MKTTMLLTALLLSTAVASLAPVASANHCGQYPVGEEVYCMVNERVAIDPYYQRVVCFYENAPNTWVFGCVLS